MIKGISANGKHSFNDFGLSIAERKISPPSLKRITETVPYMNGEYDFSALNGEIALEPRELYYSFDIAELTTESMEQIKTFFLSWLYSIVNTKIYDDYLSEYYFYGSLDKIDWSEDFGKGTIGVTFSAYPYMYAKEETIVKFMVENELIKNITTNSSHDIVPIITTDSDLTIEKDDKIYTLSSGSYENEDFVLGAGDNNIKFSGNANVKISFRDEVI